MTRFLVFCFLLLLVAGKTNAQPEKSTSSIPEICITQTELELYRLINEYRAQRGLPKIKLSKSLSVVARTHAIDQAATHKYASRCNLHSWSANGKWSSCCYTPDHKKAACMWDKPRELTNYQGDGFEISFYSSFIYVTPEAFAKDILDGWKKSPGHNEVIINRNNWSKVNWQAIGIGIYGEYANVWFGKEIDNAGEPDTCE